MTYLVKPVGHVESSLRSLDDAPRQGDEGAPTAWLVLDAAVAPALEAIGVGDELVVLTWLHEAQRDQLRVHPRGDLSRPAVGVFATRAPSRPNPIGLHTVRVLAIDGSRVQVADLEAIDGTPLVDIKPALGPLDSR
jgi:tRNA-Thr(GGU) m(6)t(6)A37 methyltransferase TsaA